MSLSKTLFLGLAVVSLSACSTTASLPSANDVLLSGIEKTADLNTNGVTRLLSTSNPTCLQFYKNTASFAALPAAAFSVPSIPGVSMPGVSVPGVSVPGVSVPDVPGVPKIKKPSFGGQLLKTVALGALSGVVGGGVSSLGIKNNFLESTLIGTANQVTYNTGSTIYDSILGSGTPGTPDPTTAEGQAAIAAAAAAAEAEKAHNLASHTHSANGDIIITPAPAASATDAATAAAAASTPMAAIEAAASQLGCPAPDAAAIAALKLVK